MFFKKAIAVLAIGIASSSALAGGVPSFPQPTPQPETKLVVGYAGSGVQNQFDIKNAIKEEIKPLVDQCSSWVKVYAYLTSIGITPTPDEKDVTNYAKCSYEVLSAILLSDGFLEAGLSILKDISMNVVASALGYQFESSAYNLYTEDLLSNSPDSLEFASSATRDSIHTLASTFAPAYADFKNQQYTAYTEHNSLKLMIMRRGKDDNKEFGWKDLSTINGHKSRDKPSLAVFKNKLYLSFTGSSSNKLYITSTSDGVNWESARLINGHKSSKSPTLAVVKTDGIERLVAGFRGSSSKNLYFSGTYDGHNWNSANKVSDQSSNAPYLASHNGALFATFKGASTNNIYIIKSIDGGLTWSRATTLSSAHRSNRAPAISSHDGYLYMAYKGISSKNVYWIRSIDGLTNWSSATNKGAKTSGSLTLYTAKK